MTKEFDSLGDKQNSFTTETPQTDKTRRRKIIQTETLEVSVVPNVEQLMGDALTIIGNELAYYRAKTKRNINLDLKEARAVQSYMDALVKMSREAREHTNAQTLQNLSDEELKALANKVLNSD